MCVFLLEGEEAYWTGFLEKSKSSSCSERADISGVCGEDFTSVEINASPPSTSRNKIGLIPDNWPACTTASANAPMVAKRSLGSFSSDFNTAFSRAVGI